MMQHPYWYMKPIHIFLRMIGVKKITLGSTGNSGRAASDSIVHDLKNGYSTIILPDGPNGPQHHLRKGMLHMSKQSQVAIVAMRLHFSRSITMKTWDKKVIPLPFSKATIRFMEPFHITEENFLEAVEKIAKLLGD